MGQANALGPTLIEDSFSAGHFCSVNKPASCRLIDTAKMSGGIIFCDTVSLKFILRSQDLSETRIKSCL